MMEPFLLKRNRPGRRAGNAWLRDSKQTQVTRERKTDREAADGSLAEHNESSSGRGWGTWSEGGGVKAQGGRLERGWMRTDNLTAWGSPRHPPDRQPDINLPSGT